MSEKTSVSFSFNKRSSKKSLVRIDDSLNEQKDFVTSVEDKQIQRYLVITQRKHNIFIITL